MTTFKAPATIKAGIERAIKLVRHGFMKGGFGGMRKRQGKMTQCYCADGALRMAFTGARNSDEAPGQPNTGTMLKAARTLLRQAIEATGYEPVCKYDIGDNEYFVYHWNDAKERTQGEVIKALQTAAKAAA